MSLNPNPDPADPSPTPYEAYPQAGQVTVPPIPPIPPGFAFPRDQRPKASATLIAVDICAFGDLRRDDLVQLHLRDQMYRILSQACTMTGLSLPDCYNEDRGDGVLIVAPPEPPADDLLAPFAYHLTAVLRRYNRLAGPISHIRMRVALHTGLAHRDNHGVAGRSLVHLFRLLEAGSFKAACAASAADIGVIVSDRLYEDALAHGALIDPCDFQKLRVTCKETRTWAWVWSPPNSGNGFANTISN
ncbi:hypothetical protein [Actinomadura sp. DC4]|uniref:hypothetical protein n=1 Tax=Actinomadura sp. DC4 TaxID=3055069 RepID=UPI0025B03F67|nr:hypothetical protein [Actinomadura sp. DC4]MDN3353674.1 hypothetical protein [Actinomadura sp. DC4]